VTLDGSIRDEFVHELIDDPYDLAFSGRLTDLPHRLHAKRSAATVAPPRRSRAVYVRPVAAVAATGGPTSSCTGLLAARASPPAAQEPLKARAGSGQTATVGMTLVRGRLDGSRTRS
jgi:hypothetical protein